MTVRPQENVTPESAPDALMSFAEDAGRSLGSCTHAGHLEGATVTGEAARRQLSLRVGLWLDASGMVRQARWRAVRDPALRACAEAACSLLESGMSPSRLHPAALRDPAAVARAEDHADLVVAAVQAAFNASVIAR